MLKLIAPSGVSSTNIGGKVYIPDENGEVEVDDTSHVEILTGFPHNYVSASSGVQPLPVGESPPDPADVSEDPDDQTEHGDEPPSEDPEEESSEEKDDESEEGESEDKGLPSFTEEEILALNRVDLIEFIEERGGEVPPGAKKAELAELALTFLTSKD